MAATFGPFELDRLLGGGGMGEVYLAHRLADPQRVPVVVKCARPELNERKDVRRRLVLEAQVAARLAHPNLVRMLEYGKVGDNHYLEMDYVRGHSLQRLMEHAFEKDAPPPSAAGLNVIVGVLAGLAAMHESKDVDGSPRPFLHRDVKPANVIITREGRPVIIDYGIAKDLLGPGITAVGQVMGTAHYMAPEHRMGRGLDPRADVFAASVMLFELLTARHPWPKVTDPAEVARVLFEPPMIFPETRERIAADVLPIVLKGLAVNPAERWPDAPSMLRALMQAASIRAVARDPWISVRAWIDATGIPSDEAISQTPIEGAIGAAASSAEIPAADPETLARVPRARAVTLPPLPTRRHSSIETASREHNEALARSEGSEPPRGSGGSPPAEPRPASATPAAAPRSRPYLLIGAVLIVVIALVVLSRAFRSDEVPVTPIEPARETKP